MSTDSRRCPWCGDQPDYIAYHDQVWGRPVAGRNELFEKLCLDGQQAGLSWLTILRKQQGYREAFAGFSPEALTDFTDQDVEVLLGNPAIVRNRKKVESIIGNARALLAMEDNGEDFPAFLWSFTGGGVQINNWRTQAEVPTESPESRAMSRALRKRGFRFVGPTICYAFMQAVGMVNDHLLDCPVRAETRRLSEAFALPIRDRSGPL